MLKKKAANPKGLTIVELLVALSIGIIILLGIGIVLADSCRGWNAMYNRIYSDVVVDGHIARRVFDRVIRKASGKNILVDGVGTWVEVSYYADGASTDVDRYARFYWAGSELNIEYGRLNPKETLSTRTVCSNVSSCVFTATRASVQMVLMLDNGSEAATVTSSAVAHN